MFWLSATLAGVVVSKPGLRLYVRNLISCLPRAFRWRKISCGYLQCVQSKSKAIMCGVPNPHWNRVGTTVRTISLWEEAWRLNDDNIYNKSNITVIKSSKNNPANNSDHKTITLLSLSYFFTPFGPFLAPQCFPEIFPGSNRVIDVHLICPRLMSEGKIDLPLWDLKCVLALYPLSYGYFMRWIYF